jgi:hypothetical protein
MVRQQLLARGRNPATAQQPAAAAAPGGRDQSRGGGDEAARWRAYASALPDELQPGSAARPVPTRCVGCGYGKSRRLLSVWQREQRAGSSRSTLPEVLPEVPFLSSDCEVTVQQITQGDEMIVLGSWGLEELVSPQEAALLAHAFGGPKLAALRDAYVGSSPAVAAAAAGGQATEAAGGGASLNPNQQQQPAEAGAAAVAADGGRLREGNVASAVAHWAMTKALQRHNRVYRQRLDYAGLKVRAATACCVDSQLALPELVVTCTQRPHNAHVQPSNQLTKGSSHVS